MMDGFGICWKIQARWIATARELVSHGPTVIFGALALAIAGCSTETHQTPVSYQTISFDSTDVGQLPAGFSTALTGGGGPISWVVREDPAAPDNHRVLVQESSDETSYRFPVCVYDNLSAKDVAVEVKWKGLSGKVDEAGGIVLRYSPENYYIARANVLEDNVDLFKTVKGKRIKISEIPVKVTGDEWHTLRFEAKGKHLKVSFDGQVISDVKDSTLSRPGKIGLWTKADSVSAFTDLKVEPVN